MGRSLRDGHGTAYRPYRGTPDFDAIVIGGGPAGGAASLLLARLGWRVALIDRRASGESKACGYCLNRRAFPLLRKLGVLDAVRARASSILRGCEIHAGATRPGESPAETGRIFLDGNRGGSLTGVVIDRAILDALIIDRAEQTGVEILRPATAQIWRRAGDTVMIELKRTLAPLLLLREHLTCRLVIGADGLGSRVARAAGLADACASTSLRASGGKIGFAFDSTSPALHHFAKDRVHLFLGQRGYIGVVRSHEHSHIGGLMKRGVHHPTAVEFAEEVMRSAIGDSATLRPRNMYAVTPIPWRPRRIANSRCALVGDAAGYSEPFTGEGITWALESAFVLGGVLAREERGAWSERAAAVYAAHWRRAVGRRQRLSRLLALGLERPWLARTGMALFARLDRIPQLLSDLVYRESRAEVGPLEAL